MSPCGVYIRRMDPDGANEVTGGREDNVDGETALRLRILPMFELRSRSCSGARASVRLGLRSRSVRIGSQLRDSRPSGIPLLPRPLDLPLPLAVDDRESAALASATAPESKLAVRRCCWPVCATHKDDASRRILLVPMRRLAKVRTSSSLERRQSRPEGRMRAGQGCS